MELQYDSAAPTAAWPGVINEDPQAHDPGNGIVCLEFVQAPDVAVPTVSTQYATLFFTAGCQEELNVAEILFDRTSNDNFVDTYDGGTTSHSPQNWDDGSVTITDYQGTFEIAEVTGYLGDVNVRVPISGTTYFNMYGVYHFIEYDYTKLDFIEGMADTITFPNPYTQSFTEIEPGRILAVIYDYPYTWTPPITDQEVYSLIFDIRPDYQGSPNSDDCMVEIDFIADTSAVMVAMGGGPGGAFCTHLLYCLDTEDYVGGGINIPLYSAALRSEYDGDYIVRTDGIQQLVFDVSMLNSFPAGDYSDQSDNGGAAMVFDLPGYFTHYNLTEESGAPDFHPMTYMNGDRILYAYQEYNAARDNYWEPQTGYVNLFHETVYFNEALFDPDYDNRTVALAFRDEFASQGWCTHVEDTTGIVDADSANGKLTWESVPAEVKMGRFYTPYVESMERYVDQPLYISANFDIGEFSVNVSIDGACEIYSVTPEASGVEYTMYGDSEVRIYYDGSATFHAATGDDSVLIATLEYYIDCMASTGKAVTGKYERPWVPHDVPGYVSFDYEFIEDDTGYNHFVDPEPNDILSHYCNENYTPKDQMTTLPGEFQLKPNHPNPFNPKTIISYDVASQGNIRIEIYNILGQNIKHLVNETKEPGAHEVLWDGTDDSGRRVASGIYLCRMQAGNFIQARKMILSK